MTRPLTPAEVEECARAGYEALDGGGKWEGPERIPEGFIRDARNVVEGRGDDDPTWTRAVLAKAAEIRARDGAQTVRGQVTYNRDGDAVVCAENRPIRLATLSPDAFPNLPDGATVEVTVRVIQETK